MLGGDADTALFRPAQQGQLEGSIGGKRAEGLEQVIRARDVPAGHQTKPQDGGPT